MTDKDITHKVDKLSIALVLLVTSLRSNINVDEKNKAIASIPVIVLDQIEAILKNL